MASTLNREVTLTLKTEATGQSAISDLANEVKNLAKQGGDAAAPLREIGQQLDELAAQQGAITALQQLEQEIDQTQVESAQLADTITDLSARLREKKTALDAAAASERESAQTLQQHVQALAAARLSYKDARAEVLALNSAIATAGKATKEQNAALAAAEVNVTKYRAEMAAATAAVERAKQAHTPLVAALKQAESAYKSSNTELTVANDKSRTLAETESTLSAEMDRLATGLAKAGVNTQNFARAQVEAERRLQSLRDKARDLPTYINAMAAAFDSLAAKEEEAARVEREYQAYLAQEAAALRESEAALKRQQAALADVAAFQKRAADSAYINFWQQATYEQERAAAAAKQAAAATAAVGDATERALGVVGLRSAASLKAEILNVNQALGALARDSRLTGDEFDRAFAAGKRKIAELEQQLRAADRATSGFGTRIGDAFRQFGPATLAVNAITRGIDLMINAASRIPQVAAEFESLRRGLTIVTGSTEKARREMAYLSDVANHVGGDIKALGESYLSLSAATKDTALAGVQTRRIFEAVAGSMGALGKSSAETEGALRAVSQMVSKGVVSMEEMRQQLGERLPGAFQAVSKELGITVEDLTDLISKGQLTANEVLPALAAGLEKMYDVQRRNDTLAGQWAQTTNALKAYATAQEDTVKGALQLGRLGAGAIASLGEGINFVAKATLAVGDGIRKWDFSNVLGFLTEEATKANDRVGALAGTADKTAQTVTALAAEAKAAGREFVVLADGTKVATADIDGAGNSMVAFMVASNKAQDSAEREATAARKAAEATRAAGEAAITTANAIGTETDKRKAATEVAAANAAALDGLLAKEREVLVVMQQRALRMAEEIRDNQNASEAQKQRLVALGEEIAVRRTAVEGLSRQVEAQRVLAEALRTEAQAAQDNAARVAELRQHYLDVRAAVEQLTAAEKAGLATKEQVAVATEEAGKAAKLYSDAVRDEAAAAQALAAISGDERAAREASLRAAQAQLQALKDMGQGRSDEARALQLQVAQMEVERRKMDDNSRALHELKAAYLAAKAAVEQLRLAKAAGIDVTDKLAEAEIKLAKAAAMYKDAANDQITAIQATSAAKQAEMQVEQESIRYSIEVLRTAAEVARVKGDEKAASEALLKIKELEIRLAYLIAEAKRAEAEAALLVVQAKREELLASGEMTKVKEAELKAQEASARAKMVEADIARETANRLDELKRAQESVNSASGASASASASAAAGFDSMGSAAGRAADQVERLAAGVTKVGSQYYNAQGFASDAKGNVAAQAGQGWLWAYNFLKSGGLDDATARSIASQYFDERDQFKGARGIGDNRSASQMLADEIAKYLRAGGGSSASSAAASSSMSESSSGAKTSAPPTQSLSGMSQPGLGTGGIVQHNVSITLPSGGTTNIGVRGAGDAEALKSVLARLGADMMRT